MSNGPAVVSHPLVVVGVGPLGHRVARDLVETARALEPDAPLVVLPWLGGARAEAHLHRAAREALEGLLQAGANRSGRIGLDVVVTTHAGEVPPEDPARVMRVFARCLFEDWGVLFPADAPPVERTCWGTVLAALPPLRGASAKAGLDLLAALRAERADAPHPLLARALVVPAQTTAGRLSDEALERALRGTAQALWLSGQRGDDTVAGLLAHRADDRFVTGLSVAAAELPVARLRRYARWRLALDGLQELVSRAEHPTGDPARAEALVSRLSPDELLDPFGEGEAAQRVRRHAATLSGAADRLPDDLDVRLVERDTDLNQRFRVLLGPATKPPPDRATEDPEHAEVLRALDRDEAFALNELDRRVDHLLAQELEPATALSVLPHLERALVRAAHALEEELAEAVDPLPALDPPPPPIDPGRDALHLAVEGRPRLGTVIPLALAIAAVVGIAAGLGIDALMSPSEASASVGTITSAGSIDPTAPSPWIAGGSGMFIGLLVATGWAFATLRGGKLALQDALIARRAELDGLWSRGGGGQPGRQASALLAVRRRRVATGLAARLRAATTRLSAARASLRRSRDHARRELERLRVRLANDPREDGLNDVLGVETPLHRPLLPAAEVAARLARARPVQEPARIAQSLLKATWPREGLVHDLPAADLDALGAAADALLPVLGPAEMLQGPDVTLQVEQRLARFVQDLPAGLAPGLNPRDPHGDPVPVRSRWVVVGPAALRGALADRLRDRDVLACWTDAPVPWVVVLATWADLDVDSVTRGAGGSA